MPRLWPGIRKQDEHPIQAPVRQMRNHVSHITVMQSDIGQTSLVDMSQHAGNTILEGLCAQDQDIGTLLALAGHMLPAAKADLQPNLNSARH